MALDARPEGDWLLGIGFCAKFSGLYSRLIGGYMLGRLINRFTELIGAAGSRIPSSTDFSSTVRSDGSTAPTAGLDVVRARREQAVIDGTPDFVVETINRAVPSLEELEQTALTILECEFETAEEWLAGIRLMSPREKLQTLHASHLSRWFARAVHELTGFPAVGIGVLGEQAVSFGNLHPSSLLINAYGFVSIEELQQELGDSRLQILGPMDMTDMDCDDTMAFVMASLACLEHDPFPGLRSNALLWVKKGSLRPWIP